MPLRSRLLIGALVVLVLGFGVMLAVWPGARTRLGLTAAAKRIRAGGEPAATRSAEVQETETVELTLEVPPYQPEAEGEAEQTSVEAEVERTGPRPERCPKTKVQLVLKMTFATPRGCVVGSVDPGGPADKAGLKPGDSIVGCGDFAVTCPKTLVEHVEPWPVVRTVKLTVERPKTADASAETE